MFHDAFIKLDRQESAAILDEVNPLLSGGGFDPAATTVLAQDLPFYPGHRFLDISDYETMPPFRKFAVCGPGGVRILDWSAESVYALNRTVPALLTSATLVPYVRFFFAGVRGPHGRIILAETPDDIDWSEEPPPAARKALGKLLCPLVLEGKNPDGSWRLSATVIFRAMLCSAVVTVSPEGTVALGEEKILIESIPVTDDSLGQ